MTDHRSSNVLELVKDANIRDIYREQWYRPQQDFPTVQHQPGRTCLDSATKLLIDQVLMEPPSLMNVGYALDILENWLRGCGSQQD